MSLLWCSHRNGDTLASGSHDNTVRLWDVQSGDLLETLAGHTGNVYIVVYSPEDSTIASGSWDGHGLLVGQPNRRTVGKRSEGIRGMSLLWRFHPDSDTLACGNDDTVHLWDVQTGTLLHSLTGHTDLVDSLAYSPDGQSLASGSRDGTILLWDLTESVPDR